MRLGVLGSMVWDTIDHPDAERVHRWGGISYSLVAAAAALPDGWTIRPIIKLGDDLAEEALAFLGTIPAMEGMESVVRVPEPNNRVHLRYSDRHRRHETLTGGVPAWEWSELAPLLDGLDALYVNLISGFELTLDSARQLASRVPGLVYADLHSLLMGVDEEGGRVPRVLTDRESWLDAFDTVQLNEDELALVAGRDDPEAVGREAVRRAGTVVLITRGPAGALWFARSEAPHAWEAEGEVVRKGVLPLEGPAPDGDPTGCGDVWGATCFVALTGGEALPRAVAAANAAARRNVKHQGSDGLYEHLRSRP